MAKDENNIYLLHSGEVRSKKGNNVVWKWFGYKISVQQIMISKERKDSKNKRGQYNTVISPCHATRHPVEYEESSTAIVSYKSKILLAHIFKNIVVAAIS